MIEACADGSNPFSQKNWHLSILSLDNKSSIANFPATAPLGVIQHVPKTLNGDSQPQTPVRKHPPGSSKTQISATLNFQKTSGSGTGPHATRCRSARSAPMGWPAESSATGVGGGRGQGGSRRPLRGDAPLGVRHTKVEQRFFAGREGRDGGACGGAAARGRRPRGWITEKRNEHSPVGKVNDGRADGRRWSDALDFHFANTQMHRNTLADQFRGIGRTTPRRRNTAESCLNVPKRRISETGGPTRTSARDTCKYYELLGGQPGELEPRTTSPPPGTAPDTRAPSVESFGSCEARPDLQQ